MHNRGSANDGDVVKDSMGDGIEEVEFSYDFPGMTVASAPSGSSPYALSLLPSFAHGIGHGIKKLENAQPNDPGPSAGLRMADSLESSPVVARKRDGAPGAFQV